MLAKKPSTKFLKPLLSKAKSPVLPEEAGALSGPCKFSLRPCNHHGDFTKKKYTPAFPKHKKLQAHP